MKCDLLSFLSCKNIFQICTQYNVGLLTKEVAQEALNVCDLSKKESFKAFIQRDFSNIFAVEEQIVEDQPKKRGKKAEMPIIEAMPEVHEVVETEK